ncbi:MAG: ABC transporter permease [Clostridiales bacterium]|nr:ABC transporter permease [Clostridiales bacterium]
MRKKNKDLIKYSNEHKLYLKKQKTKKIVILTSQILLLLFFISLWELLTHLKILDSFIMSSPSRIYFKTVDLFTRGNLMYHIWITLKEAILGFIIATGLGTLIAIILWWSEYTRKILEPYIVILNSLPKIALGPIIIIWFGAGTQSIVVMAVLITIIITILTMLNAFLACDKDKIMLLKSMGANKFKILTKLIIPSALPEFISMLKINVGMTWVGTIMGEYLVSKAGLGYLIVYGGQVFQLDLVMTSTVILCILAGLMYFLVAQFEKHFKKY